ncbi:MAG: glucoamylase family protein [Micropepsaceae bacterium]
MLRPKTANTWSQKFTAPPLTVIVDNSNLTGWHSEELARDELLSAEGLEKQAGLLAARQTASVRRPRSAALIGRLAANESLLLQAYNSIAGSLAKGQPITPAAEWLVDNYHLVEDQIREIRLDLPPGYYRQLPELTNGPLIGLPRVFELAWTYIAHTDSRFDAPLLCRFVNAYQRVQLLTIGELWAVAITLRIMLVENLKRATQRIVKGQQQRAKADELADRILSAHITTNSSMPDLLRPFDTVTVSSTFAAQLIKRLRDQDPNLMPVMQWLEEKLQSQATSSDAVVQSEHMRQAGMSVTVRNIITSMRHISAVDWAEVFESMSSVDELLRSRTSFAQMDFPTRNQYRSAIEDLSRRSPLSEIQVTHRVLDEMAVHETPSEQLSDTERRRRSDPGYPLISAGRLSFERKIGYQPSLAAKLGRYIASAGYIGYIAAIAIVTASLLGLAFGTFNAQIAGWWWPTLIGLALFPAMDAAVAIVNRLATMQFAAKTLPGLELKHGVPADLRTLVAVPVLLTSLNSVDEQIDGLEVHYLASQDGNLHFALLSDWPDALTPEAPGDQALLNAAIAGIEKLNDRYGPAPGGRRFNLLHRRRTWNAAQKRWMGWERKRGKLHELNRALRGATDTTFLSLAPNASLTPVGIKYVITLDADTRLPHGAACKLVGKMAHPLNRPRFDRTSGRVVEGYAILQPRMTATLPTGTEQSLFQKVFSTSGGIDPYTAAVSDVYQDLFGEGSYAGKGIYDVDVFEAALADRVPENSLLSHDLFEGIFARAGLVSDIELFEDFPTRYDVAASRLHRWARGDWQLLPWIFGRGAPGTDQDQSAIPLGSLWKMLDNLRRTLSAPACIAALAIGWTLPLNLSVEWTLFILATIALPPMLPLTSALFPPRSGITWQSHWQNTLQDAAVATVQIAFTLTFLAHQAWLMIDAIGRTFYRLFFTHRRLLEWVTAAQASFRPQLDLSSVYGQMAGAVALAMASLLLSATFDLRTAPLALPFAVLWSLSPLIARWSSNSPLTTDRASVSPTEAEQLRLIARRTWRYFETFVTSQENMLPPDNFQEDPQPAVANRTSPTNIGLYLLSTIAARDQNWIGTHEMAERLEGTLATIRKLELFRGHLFNWYDTRDLRPLEPRYISSVDSGNLAGHLIAVANACTEYSNMVPTDSATKSGALDALALARRTVSAHFSSPNRSKADLLARHIADCEDALSGAASGSKTPSAEREAAQRLVSTARHLLADTDQQTATEILFWCEAAERSLASHARDQSQANELKARLIKISHQARALFDAMDFRFLINPELKLLSIGFVVATETQDPSCYDLLASEARLASFVAIAKGDAPARHWFRLGRLVTSIRSRATLISWSGSMFEYLMPALVMRAPEGSLLATTNRQIVSRQIAYGQQVSLPWGVSESAYNTRDQNFTYQYSNFGVPGLGLKRGLSDDFVVAPYATALAAMVNPTAACKNFLELARLGADGKFGFCESIDFTSSRIPEGHKYAVVRAYMAHHQGMTIVALSNVLGDGRMRTRFHSEARVRAIELLLQERAPREVALAPPRAEEVRASRPAVTNSAPSRQRAVAPDATPPPTTLLSNGRYATMVSAAGGGYSLWDNIAITRWREDPTCDRFGPQIYLRDTRTGETWSAALQPPADTPNSSKILFANERAQITRWDDNLTTILDVLVSPESDGEVRRVTIANHDSRAHEIEITYYAELVLAPAAADWAHPSFSKLFVETDFIVAKGMLLATRRRRTQDEKEVWVSMHAVVDGSCIGGMQIETDRARFIGRGRSMRNPLALSEHRPLSNSVGAMLDPAFASRQRVSIPPGGAASIAYWTMAASTREGVIALADRNRDANAFERATNLAWSQGQIERHHLGITQDQADSYQRLASHVLYPNLGLRAPAQTIERGALPASALWALGISGDLPFVLVRLDEEDDLKFVRDLIQAHEYWQRKQFYVDLVILNDRSTSYMQDLQESLDALVRIGHSRRDPASLQKSGKIFVLRRDQMSPETRSALLSQARVELVARRGTLIEQLNRHDDRFPQKQKPAKRQKQARQIYAPKPASRTELEYFNGIGGFGADGREYVVTLKDALSTPAPWINVISNEQFGFQVSADGSGYTWSQNSRENQLTEWSNDPVSDRSPEVIYIRDDDTGELWTPTPAPIRRNSATYSVRHGQGYSRFEHTTDGLSVYLLQHVARTDPVKITRLTIRNTSRNPRRLTVTGYIEWLMGPPKGLSGANIITNLDPSTRAILARNPLNTSFPHQIAFADLAGLQTSWTCDRTEFLGRNGCLAEPEALHRRASLQGRSGAGLDPCAALQRSIELKPGESAEVLLLLGSAPNVEAAQATVAKYRTADLNGVLDEITEYWDSVLNKVQVHTPDRSMDIMLNRWLLYQTLACRLWARSAFYQSGGAYGFRDQLQDTLATTLTLPQLTRAHLLRAAARQFSEGDVQHWWLPHSGQGVRTGFSDDRIWLPYVAAHYISSTTDELILDEQIPFLQGKPLAAGESDAFSSPSESTENGSLYEHCARALDMSLSVGIHGLPLIGTGDWNDGFNHVGANGKGESIWLGWFLHSTLMSFIPIAQRRGDDLRAKQWHLHCQLLQTALERDGWDGDWYRRAYFDNGTPLGSGASEQCRIDSIAQSWAVLSGAADRDRSRQAMAAVETLLIDRENGLAVLFGPPFDKSNVDPGYVKSYPPGIRENGGQYTHAAVWSAMAFAELGQGDKAAGLFWMLNPINRSRTFTDAQRYRVEPYAVAADVYSVPPHVGRGGWTWYTGAAGWLYRAGLESILGFRVQGNVLHINPCIPNTWPGFEIKYRHGTTTYEISVQNPFHVSTGVSTISLDGSNLPDHAGRIDLVDDALHHMIRVQMG